MKISKKSSFNASLLFLIFLLIPAYSTFSLSVQRGHLQLSVNEANGRFSLAYTKDLAKQNFTPLFLADNQKTTKMKVFIGDKTFVLGDDKDFLPLTTQTSTGILISWTSKDLVIQESLDFLTSQSSSVADGLKITFNLKNMSSKTLKVGLRYVLDTNLGEKKDHFITSEQQKVQSETEFTDNFPDYILSPSFTDSEIGLMLMLGKAVTLPHRVILANWKRLDDSNWDFDTKPGRDFNLLPYSFNDSAVALYYEMQDLPTGKNREVVLEIGNKTAKTFVNAKVGVNNVLGGIMDSSRSADAVDQDLAVVNDLLKQLDDKLADPAHMNDEDWKFFQATIEQLEQKRMQYANK